MELKANDLGPWTLGAPPARLSPAVVTATLIFGQDEGGVQELGRALVAGESDLTVVDGGGLTAMLPDLLATLSSGSLFAANPAILVREADDRQAAAIEAMTLAARGGTPFGGRPRLVVTGGDLKATSKLRKLFAGENDLVSTAIWRMRGREIAGYAQATLAELGARIEKDALAALADRLPGDRAMARRDCEVLALYALGQGRALTRPDVAAVLDDIDEDGIAAPLDHALDGQAVAALRALRRRLDSGENPVGLLRAFGRRGFQIREMVASGKPAKAAVDAARPPIFWAEKDAMVRRVAGLDLAGLDALIAGIDRAEQMIVEEGAPADVVLGRLLIADAAIRTSSKGGRA